MIVRLSLLKKTILRDEQSSVITINRYTMLKDGKKRKNVSIYMHDTLKTNCEEKNSRKKGGKRQQQKTVLMGFEPTSTKIDGF